MKIDKFVSVIVPIYNTEKFLVDCIESLLGQTYTNIEIILVNNGSNDQSPDICERFKEKDCRIKVFHKTHGSISSGRNLGIEFASGEYITFVDSDDTVGKELIANLVDVCEKTSADIALCKASRLYIDLKEEAKESGEVVSFGPKEAIVAWLYEKQFGSEVWAKLYRRDCIKDIRFPEKRCEDVCYLYEAFNKAEKISLIDKRLYNYRMHRLYEHRSAYRRPVEDEKVEVLDFISKDVGIKYPSIYDKIFGANSISIFASILRIYAAQKVKEQNNYIESARKYLWSYRKEIALNQFISKKIKKQIRLYLKHIKIFNIMFKIRNKMKKDGE